MASRVLDHLVNALVSLEDALNACQGSHEFYRNRVKQAMDVVDSAARWVAQADKKRQPDLFEGGNDAA